MISIFKKYKTFIFIFLGVSILIFIGIYTLLQPQKTLPIFTPRDVNPQLVDSTIQHVGYNHRIADFKFTNQNGIIITQDDYKDKIYVAEFFFTTCPTICPIMTDNLVWLQDKIKSMPDVLILSHSVTPDIDSVPVLKKYALEKGVVDSKWNLVTGNKKDIYYIARKSYLAVETGKPEELYDMVHTENLVLIDKKGRIRGFYDGTNLDKPTEDGTKNVTQLFEDIKWLSEIEK
ncbi:SCO family protein [uncultured Flavobacterium sp.]|uniref:SCO family protein n=1 Tax=uncultured Flavobacterium sp. TaxID=165435 RepID=UPI0030EF6D0E